MLLCARCLPYLTAICSLDRLAQSSFNLLNNSFLSPLGMNTARYIWLSLWIYCLRSVEIDFSTLWVLPPFYNSSQILQVVVGSLYIFLLVAVSSFPDCLIWAMNSGSISTGQAKISLCVNFGVSPSILGLCYLSAFLLYSRWVLDYFGAMVSSGQSYSAIFSLFLNFLLFFRQLIVVLAEAWGRCNC